MGLSSDPSAPCVTNRPSSRSCRAQRASMPTVMYAASSNESVVVLLLQNNGRTDGQHLIFAGLANAGRWSTGYCLQPDRDSMRALTLHHGMGYQKSSCLPVMNSGSNIRQATHGYEYVRRLSSSTTNLSLWEILESTFCEQQRSHLSQ